MAHRLPATSKTPVIIAFVFGIALALPGIKLYEITFSANKLEAVKPYREKNEKYTFINPLLFYDTPESKEFTEYAELEKTVQEYITRNQSAFKTQNVSVYFRDLSNGQWFGINEDDTFEPHSLLKVAYLIAFLKKVEKTPNFLESRLVYTPQLKSAIDKIPYENNSDLVVNQSYPVKTLLEKMIVQSDNVAKDILFNNTNTSDLVEVLTDLGIQIPEKDTFVISAKTYASFFRILYNTTYLSRTSSEWALQLLNDSSFQYGLRGTLPKEIKIAHKYGIKATQNEGVGLELHDCGIIYKPNSPYLLCIMTRGYNAQGLSNTIAGISNVVYSKVGQNKE